MADNVLNCLECWCASSKVVPEPRERLQSVCEGGVRIPSAESSNTGSRSSVDDACNPTVNLSFRDKTHNCTVSPIRSQTISHLDSLYFLYSRCSNLLERSCSKISLILRGFQKWPTRMCVSSGASATSEERRRRAGHLKLKSLISGASSFQNGATSFVCAIIFVGVCLQNRFADACSSRSTPKPKPLSPTMRPNITIQTFTCPLEYDTHYCLNGATCFTVKIGESILYNCECSDGYMGQRCEFKDLDGSYLPSKHRALLEQAGITSGVVIVVVFLVLLLTSLYLRARGHHGDKRARSAVDETDGYGHVDNPRTTMTTKLIKRPFSA